MKLTITYNSYDDETSNDLISVYDIAFIMAITQHKISNKNFVIFMFMVITGAYLGAGIVGVAGAESERGK